MDGSLDIQAAWPMPDDNFDFLGDFDEVAPLDLFGTIGPKDEAGSSGCNTAAAASQCSGDIDAPSQPVPTGLELRKDKLAAVKEINKRAQKRFRDKQKVAPGLSRSILLLQCCDSYGHLGYKESTMFYLSPS